MEDIRIAAVISNSPVGRIRDNLDQLIKWVRKAQERDAALICFPELNITGYSNHPDIIQHAQKIPGPITDELVQLARNVGITILAGMVEKNNQGRFFATHLAVTPEGEIGVYRKLHTSPPECEIYTPGDQIPLFEVSDAKFGIQLCYDAHFPELSTAMALNGVDIIFIPHASPRGTASVKHNSWMRHLTARAYDNGVFIVACNQTGDNLKGLNFPGNAVIICPSGEILDQSLSGKEGILVADLRTVDLAWVRHHKMRYFLPNRRPELYKGIQGNNHR